METIDQLLKRVRDYDQHTSDADIDRLCDIIDELRAENERLRSLLQSYRELPEQYHQGMLELLVKSAFEAAEISHGRAAELLGCSYHEIMEKGWTQGKKDEEIERLRGLLQDIEHDAIHGMNHLVGVGRASGLKAIIRDIEYTAKKRVV